MPALTRREIDLCNPLGLSSTAKGGQRQEHPRPDDPGRRLRRLHRPGGERARRRRCHPRPRRVDRGQVPRSRGPGLIAVLRGEGHRVRRRRSEGGPNEETTISKRDHVKQQQQPVVGTEAATIPREQVAVLAYEIWMERGRCEGMDPEDWFEEERQLNGRNPHESAGRWSERRV